MDENTMLERILELHPRIFRGERPVIVSWVTRASKRCRCRCCLSRQQRRGALLLLRCRFLMQSSMDTTSTASSAMIASAVCKPCARADAWRRVRGTDDVRRSPRQRDSSAVRPVTKVGAVNGKRTLYIGGADAVVAEVACAGFGVDTVHIEPRKTVAEQDDLVIRARKPADEETLVNS